MNKPLLLLLLVCLAACSKGGGDDMDFYPSILTEFAMVRTNDAGTMVELTRDNNSTYTLTNPQEGYDKNVSYRAVCGFVPDGQRATLYHLTGAYMLSDSTSLAYEPDATSAISVWQSGHYINMHLSTLTQGGRQYWGYLVGETSGRTTHLCLHHRQNGDPLSYSQAVYASISTKDLEFIPSGDSIALHIKTFKGERVWKFKKP